MNKEQIVKSFEVILEMLRDRGTDLGDLENENINEILRADSLKQVIEIVINNIKVVYYTPMKFKWADVKKHFEDTEKCSLYILSKYHFLLKKLNIDLAIFDFLNK